MRMPTMCTKATTVKEGTGKINLQLKQSKLPQHPSTTIFGEESFREDDGTISDSTKGLYLQDGFKDRCFGA